MSTPAEPPLPIQPGDLVAGKYRIERVLARGGMGAVFVARHEQLDQRVAIKILLPEVASSPEAVARFLREAQAAARIRSEHVCRVFDVGTLPIGAPYMVMELLEGTDLAAELQRRGPLPVAEAVSNVVQALDAVIEAHRRGVVHRDLKPGNIFLSRREDGRVLVKILDFGISKVEAPGGKDFKLTSTQAVMGSPAYMSPEQVRSTRDVDARSDLWSVGVILHESITGRQLFNGSSLGELFAQIREDPIPSVTIARAEVPAELDQIITRCLQRRLDLRFASAAELREALLSFLGRYQAARSEPLPSALGWRSSSPDAAFAQTGLADPGRSLPPPPGDAPTVGAWTTPQPARSRRGVWVASSLLLLLLGGAAGAWALLAGGERTPAADPRPAVEVSAAPPVTVAPASAAPEPSAAPEVAPAESASAAPAVTAAPALSAAKGASARPSAAPAAPPRSPAPRPPAGKRPSSSLDDVLGSQH